MPHGAIEWIEIPANDLKQSPLFFEAVFGWKINREPGWEQYPMFMDTANHVGGGFHSMGKPVGDPAGNLLGLYQRAVRS